MTMLDPVCDMVVDVAEARAKGLVATHEGREFAFCAPGCRTRFLKDPSQYAAKVLAHEAEHHAGGEHAGPHNQVAAATLAIDEGVRQWYRSCRCCLSDAYPEVVTQLDAERDAAKAAKAGPGICETAEAATKS